MDELAFIVFMVAIIIVSGKIASNARDKREKEVYIKTEKKKYESDVAQLTKECQYLREQLEKTQKKVANDTHIKNSLRNEIKNLEAETLRLVDENFVPNGKVAQYEKVALKDLNTISIHLKQQIETAKLAEKVINYLDKNTEVGGTTIFDMKALFNDMGNELSAEEKCKAVSVTNILVEQGKIASVGKIKSKEISPRTGKPYKRRGYLYQ